MDDADKHAYNGPDYGYQAPQQYPPQYQQPYYGQPHQPAPSFPPNATFQPPYHGDDPANSRPRPPVAYPHQPQTPLSNQYRPSQNAAPMEYGGEKASFEETFAIAKPKFNDLWAGILLIVVFAGFVVVSALSLRGFADTSGGGIDAGATFALNSNTAILFAFVLVVAFVLSILYVFLARQFPKQFIWVTGILNIVFALGTAIFYLYKKYYSGGIVFLVFAVFLMFCFWTWISRIPFSALMLRTSVDVSKSYGHVYLVSLLGGLVATALAGWYSVTLVGIYSRYWPSDSNPNCADGGCSQATVAGLIAYVTFAMYWISEWLKNTIHTIIAGVYGSWYFCAHNFPARATRGAMKRALTYSFGSISLGSLLVAIVQFLRQVCSAIRSQASQEGGIGGAIGYAVFCFAGCLLFVIEWAVNFLNRYAFCHIALYGKAYFPAAKDTWKMIKDRGLDALVNDCLIGPVLSFGALFIAYACALLAYLYLLFTDPTYNENGDYTVVIVAFSFLVGLQIAHVFTTPLSSGIETIFVAAGWDPQVMVRDHPELYNEMVKVYPKARQAIQYR